MPDNEMFCHACHHEWRQESDAIDCPACSSASTEIITPENDPRQFHAQQQPQNAPAPVASATPASHAGPAATASAAADLHPNERQPDAHNGAALASDVDQEMRDAPANEPEDGGRASDPGVPAAGPRPNLLFVLPPPMVTLTATVVAETHVPPPNTAGPRGPPVMTYFTMNFFPPPLHRHPSPPAAAGETSPPATADTPAEAPHDGVSREPHPAHRPMPLQHPLAWLERAMGSMVPMPGGIPLSDAVFSQEALDRIISQLREQHGVGGAPPASQAAMEKLQVKQLDEKMLGGEASTRCVICVDEMTVGEKASVLPCSHFFHGECVTPWLKQHNTCPVCRRSVEPDVTMPAKATEFAHNLHPGRQEQPQQEQTQGDQGCS